LERTDISLKFQVPPGNSLGSLFGFAHSMKKKYSEGAQYTGYAFEYSITQTTLEQVFLYLCSFGDQAPGGQFQQPGFQQQYAQPGVGGQMHGMAMMQQPHMGQQPQVNQLMGQVQPQMGQQPYMQMGGSQYNPQQGVPSQAFQPMTQGTIQGQPAFQAPKAVILQPTQDGFNAIHGKQGEESTN